MTQQSFYFRVEVKDSEEVSVNKSLVMPPSTYKSAGS